MPINPFNPYFPAHDELFANRRKEQDLFQRVLVASTQSSLPGAWNLALVGPWGIGKTSLLRRFAWMAQVNDSPVGVVTMTATTATYGFDGFARSLLWRIHRDLSAQPRLSERLQFALRQWEPQIRLGPSLCPVVCLKRPRWNPVSISFMPNSVALDALCGGPFDGCADLCG